MNHACTHSLANAKGAVSTKACMYSRTLWKRLVFQPAMLAACFESCLRIFSFECARCCEHQGLHVKQDLVETYVFPASNAGGML